MWAQGTQVCDPNFYLSQVLSIHLWCFFFILGVFFEFIYFKKYHNVYVNYAYFYVLFFLNFLTTLK